MKRRGGERRRGVPRRAAARGRSEQGIPTTAAETPMVAAAPAPAPPSANDQFEAARKAAEQRSARSLGSSAMQLDQVVVTGTGAAVPARNVGGRTFTLVDGRWTDTRYTESGTRVTKIKAYSKAYFALLDQAPELREMFALGERVLVAGKGVALEVGGEGREELSGPELQRLVSDLGLRG